MMHELPFRNRTVHSASRSSVAFLAAGSCMLVAAVLLAVMLLLAQGARPSTAAASGRAVRLSPQEQGTLRAINQYRRAHHLHTLTIDRRLQRSARWMAGDLRTHPYFSHTDSRGRGPFPRIAAFGYPSNTYRGENLNAGFSTAAGSFQAWKRSPEHDRNMLEPHFRHIGVSVLMGNAGGSYSSYWVTDFG